MHKISLISASLLFALSFSSCEDDLPAGVDDLIADLNLEALPAVTDPVDNPASLAKVTLGKSLFWDPIIGGMKDVACATCHHPDHGYGDGLDLGIGVNGSGLGSTRTENTGGLGLVIGRVGRNSPSVLNAAYNGMTSLGTYSAEDAPMFWDGRMTSLESQCQGPPTSESEMRGNAYAEEATFDSVMARLAAIPQYVTLFDEAFGGGATSVTTVNYAKALGAFERTIVTDNSPYLRYLGGDKSALSRQQKDGLLLFFGKANCDQCHGGPMFSDFGFHALGVADNPSHPDGTDAGKDDLYQFRTPTLHNATLTGPYMHNGMFATLRDVVNFKNAGVSENQNVGAGLLDPNFTPLNLTDEEIDDLVAFLRSLTDTDFDQTAPTTVPSGLEVGGNIH
ncbi:MAG: cytochrome c peroxidase [Flavobacteriales bacterium]|nr:cytochrome c peroxidase [Flavobacteriales bacterium]